ncbi:hypothetical protein BN1200_440123 [Klebsiella variicola]|nr:hypothetical protein BN1200_440123 [Klebsiella variicola]
MISRTSQDIPAMLSLSCIRLAIVTASDERSGSCEFEEVQAHRDDLTTSRIDDDSREPEIKKATQIHGLVI